MASNENNHGQALPVADANKMERKFSHKSASEYYDPCQDFADRSLKCMRRNGFDKEMCGDYFQAYRDCKKTWVSCFDLRSDDFDEALDLTCYECLY